MKTINYGIGKEYLQHWDLKEALREIFQNFIDFGEYTVDYFENDKGYASVTISNDYQPENLEFLRIGNSGKRNDENTIGKYGEGLKMAFLIFARKELYFECLSGQYALYPCFEEEDNIGEVFKINYEEKENDCFEINFQCPYDIFDSYYNDIVKEDDIEYKHAYHGSIVNREKGRIYSNGLFVCKVDNMSRAYDLPPSVLPLTRDRNRPSSFDVSYHTSKINESYKKFTTKDLSYDDYRYVSVLPISVKENIQAITVGNQVEFVEKETGEIIKNDSVKEALKGDNFFTSIIKKLKIKLLKHLGLYDMLLEFEKKHVHSNEAKQDFEIILNKVKNE